MVDEDDDYMADLSRFLPSESAHGRNGKSSTNSKAKLPRKEKRMVQQAERKKEEEEQRNEGLGSAIPSSNIGFKMLQQMGYTLGAALGKHGQGIVEPVNIDLKRSRTGLGRDSADKEEEAVKSRRAELEQLRNRQKEKELRADFQERRRGSWLSRKIVGNYRKACATFNQLEETDSNSAKTEQQYDSDSSLRQESGSAKASITGEVEEATVEEEEEITVEMLEEILQKLRSQYNYCLYCGCKYDSAAALLSHCPGLEEDNH